MTPSGSDNSVSDDGRGGHYGGGGSHSHSEDAAGVGHGGGDGQQGDHGEDQEFHDIGGLVRKLARSLTLIENRLRYLYQVGPRENVLSLLIMS